MCKSVLLPAPDSPTMASISPCGTSKESPSKSTRRPFPVAYSLRRSLTFIWIGCPGGAARCSAATAAASGAKDVSEGDSISTSIIYRPQNGSEDSVGRLAGEVRDRNGQRVPIRDDGKRLQNSELLLDPAPGALVPFCGDGCFGIGVVGLNGAFDGGRDWFLYENNLVQKVRV